MEERPKLKIELSKDDRFIEILCFSLLIMLWAGTIAGYSTLPAQIPVHFNAAGQIDGYGRRNMIFTLPVIATVLYAVMTLLNRHPHLYNYPQTITRSNAMTLYTSATRLIRFLKLIVVFIFTLIVAATYYSVISKGSGPGQWLLPVCIGLVCLPTIWFFARMNNKPPVERRRKPIT